MTMADSKFSEELADRICERLADGESLRSICADEEMPDKSTVFRWLAANETFRDQYARAREAQADTLFDEILHIADTPQMGEKTEVSDGKIKVVSGDMIDHRRLQVDARKWMAGKLRPKKYGERLELAGDPDAPLIPVLNVTTRRD
jgi:hypothetical protein